MIKLILLHFQVSFLSFWCVSNVFADIAPSDCFSTPDGNEILIKVRKPSGRDIPDAVSLKTGEPVNVRPDTRVFPIAAKMSASVDHNYLQKKTGLSPQPRITQQPPPAQPEAQEQRHTPASQVEIIHPSPRPN